MTIEKFSLLDTALRAVHVAAHAIRGMPGIVEATADNDDGGGEIIFRVQDGQSFVLRLRKVEDLSD